ncbi:hypothetical protein A2954_07675 [Candidatus Roizmanbacteria bacterium RIFCSPLOWO2_01_FULL_37_12]|uniref:Uncharacterized protein n=1 Tax=Candidatus Roizmanbacteria bacterium RIFCSPLOWO2_01_FULL_37_12 TaxID=1802056 RepID=A0A1F7I868_9BACT|nr:MAG: hypothetical protein A3D76_01580 [Candidatus Roizmanbacteria bacterium RIFCSPHIGHO2_02_FULL_37_9b]OGK39533.1 MAG: hypothetical protein A2954_07675 [Candidatus Roizmanbacteria bacterium RIFCSPLOWO2_01_FULL_37_12]
MNQKELFWISVTIFLTIVAWMIVDIFKVKTTITVQSELKSVETVDFTIKPDILEILKERSP